MQTPQDYKFLGSEFVQRMAIFYYQILDNISKTTLKAKINDDKKFSLLSMSYVHHSFMNNQVGFNQVFDFKDAFISIVKSLNPMCLPIMGRTLELWLPSLWSMVDLKEF
ncbi:hypothetical protein SSS_03066 [Sarcoptes scabiei]|uniref:Uncharacterized protein n=1 Tax=Sarcoptes scabiei TaxID=52283 RepID=A0A834RII9_SARSC|nr:hypothetical protein SSS_03066 [Sarcoptes scabiei]